MPMHLRGAYTTDHKNHFVLETDTFVAVLYIVSQNCQHINITAATGKGNFFNLRNDSKRF